MASISPERYRRVKAILEAALELDPAEQAAYIEKACAGDPELKTEALSLLRHDRESAGFLLKPIMETAQPSYRLKPGARLGPYEVAEPLGAGAMGEVYRAHDPRFGRDVAIKLLPEAFGRDEAHLARFEREARAAGSLNHPNVLTVHDFGREDGAPYLVSELLRGETLRDRLKHAPLAPAAALDIAAQIARGLGAAHALGIVHRDLKPENIFLVRGGAVKILDFGLAKTQEPAAQGAGSPTLAGSLVGSPGYLSPEQIRCAPAGPASDIFGLGVMLYEMLTGKRPFPGDTWVEEMNATLQDETPGLPADLPGVADPAALNRAVQRCLAKQPEERFESARDLAFLLESLKERRSSKPQPRRTRAALWIAAAIVSAAGAALLIWSAYFRPGTAVTYQRLAFRHGTVSAARFTSSGDVVYSANWDGKGWGVYLARTLRGRWRSTGLARSGSMLLAVSRDDQLALCPLTELTQLTQHGVLGELATAPIAGETPRRWTDGVAAADWAPDKPTPAIVHVIGEQSRIEFPPGNSVYTVPLNSYVDGLRFSPKGDAIAFLEHPLSDDAAGWVSVIDFVKENAQPRRIVSKRYNSMRGLAWTPDGAEIWFAAAQEGTNMEVWAARRKGGPERRVASSPYYISVEDISRDWRVLLSFHSLTASMIRVSENGEQTNLYWRDQSQVRDIAPDGSILFSESGSATHQDYEAYLLRPVDGAEPTYLDAAKSNRGTGLPLAISSDGRWVIANPAGPTAPLALLPTGLPAGIGGHRQELPADGIVHTGAAWLPGDDEQFVFAGIEPGHGVRYYVQSVAGGKPVPITPEIRHERRNPIVIKPNGGSVAAVNTDGRLTVYPIGEGAGKGATAPRLDPVYTPLRWCPDGRLVLYSYDNSGQAHLWKVNPDTGARQAWKDLTPDPVGLLDVTPIRVSPNCDFYVYSPLNVQSTTDVVTGLR